MENQTKQSGLGIASLILGIVGMLFSCVAIGIVPCIIGIILGIIGIVQKNRKHGTAIGGVICSSVGIAIFLIVLLAFGNDEETVKNVTPQLQEEQTEIDENKNNTTTEELVGNQSESVKSDDEVTTEDIEILAEYTLSDGIGWYTRHFLVIRNNSSQTVDISTSSLAYSADGTMVSAADASFDALGAGCTSVMYEAFETEAQIDHYDTTINVRESEYYDSVIQDLSYTQNDIDGGAVFQVTNNGDKPAEFVEGYALYFSGDQLVDYESTYFVNDNSEINPGETISEQMTAYEDFDRIEFYMAGRASKW